MMIPIHPVQGRQLGRRDGEAASTLLNTLVLSGVLGVTALSMIEVSAYRVRMTNARTSSQRAYYHAENAMQWAVQKIADETTGGSSAPFLGKYSVSGGTVGVPYMTSMVNSGPAELKDAWVSITNHPSATEDLYQVTVSAQVSGRTRSLQATVRKNPPSVVFDYAYFLNNWGWWWGSSITGYGDNRANWDFDFRYTPTVNGGVLANGRIESNMAWVDPLTSAPPFNGLAAADPLSYVHSGVPRVQMPNLKDFSYYQAKAAAQSGKLWVGTNLIVNAVHSNSTKPGLYLKGTTAAPVKISGPVVIPGDLIISGPVTGIGTFYVGGNLYVAGNLTYANGPNFSTPPSSMTQANRDDWVEHAIDGNKDLVAFAVREAIFGGAVNSSAWKTACYDAATYGLKNVGAEANLGADGIAGTPDDGTKYLDTNGDGTPDSAWYDADGDGVVDVAYNYTTNVSVTSTVAGRIDRYPTNSSGALLSYDAVSTNSMNRLDGIFYSNHAVAMRLASDNTIWNGTVICRDEAIIFSSSLKFVYDARIHSRYSTDPNRYIDLGLPIALRVRIERVEEIAPVAGFY